MVNFKKQIDEMTQLQIKFIYIYKHPNEIRTRIRIKGEKEMLKLT